MLSDTPVPYELMPQGKTRCSDLGSPCLRPRATSRLRLASVDRRPTRSPETGRSRLEASESHVTQCEVEYSRYGGIAGITIATAGQFSSACIEIGN